MKDLSKLLGNELIRKSLYSFLLKVVGVLLGYGFTYFIALHFGATGAGIYSMSFAIFVLLGIFPRMGLDVYFTKIVSMGESRSIELADVYWSTVVISLLISFIICCPLFFLSDLLADQAFDNKDLAPGIKMVALLLPIGSLVLINAGIIRGKKRAFWYTFFTEVGRSFFGLLLLIVLVFLVNYKVVHAPVIALLGGYCLMMLLSFFLIRDYVSLKLSFDRVKLKEVFKESIPMMLISSSIYLMNWIDKIIIGIFETEASLGVYHISLRLAAITSVSLVAINGIITPKISEHYYKGEIKQLRKSLKMAHLIISALSIPTFLFLLVFRKEVLLFFGEDFVQGELTLVVLAFGQLGNAMAGPVARIMQMTGHQSAFQKILIWAMIANIALNFALIPVYGILGAAISTAFVTILWNLITFRYVRKNALTN